MDFFVEVVLGLFIGFLEMLAPDLELKKWQSVMLRILSVIFTVGILVCIAVGIDLLIEDKSSTVGLACTAVGSSLFAVQIVLSVIVFVRQVKQEKRKKSSRKRSKKQADDGGQTERSGGEE